MKTIAKTLIAAITLLFAMQVNATPINGEITPSSNQIKYVVKVNFTDIQSGITNLRLFVVMTDEHGKRVAPAQEVHPGLSTFSFYEAGPVKGTRVASLIYTPTGPAIINFFCAPDSKTGGFRNGGIYLFNLYPTTNPPNAY